ncbi:hypothetical protein PIB30_003337 [Stylosanthes scabra]|uniref:Uncharacterized protein n=1 Tax=Stylosanthes scabra TaxID=79078 RepID=A0ABU6T3G2_9FABA|nr:hypothetical protein [Stylosanthes scabra]
MEMLQGLPENTVPLKLGFCQVYLIGTGHVCQKSVADVQRLVSVMKPDLVFLELCQQRQGELTSTKIPTTTKEIVAAIREALEGR